MKTSVLSENLSRAVKIAAYATPKKPRLDVLGNVLLSADDCHLTISGSSLEVAISYRIGAKTDVMGAITVPPHTIEPWSDSRVDLETDDRQILTAVSPAVLNGPREQRYTVMGIQASEFPCVPAFDHLDTPILTLPTGKALKQAIKYVLEVEAGRRSRYDPDPVIYLVGKRNLSPGVGLGKVSPHDLRRSFARGCYRAGIAYELIRQALGHASITTTERYVNSALELDRSATDIWAQTLEE